MLIALGKTGKSLKRLIASTEKLGQSKGNDNIFMQGFGSLIASWREAKEIETISKLYDEVPQIQAVLLMGADKFSNLRWVHKRDGEVVEKSPIVAKLNRPNPLQAGKEWLSQIYVYWKLFGNGYVLENTRAGYEKYANGELNVLNFTNLPSQFTRPVGTGRYFRQYELSDIIKEYVMKNGLKTAHYSPNEILHKSDISLTPIDGGYLVGRSRLTSLSRPLTNILIAYESRNVIGSNRGAAGLFSSNRSDDSGNVALSANEKDDLQNAIKKYGTLSGQDQFMITNANIKYTPLSRAIRELMLFEEIKADAIDICNAYNMPPLLLTQEGATFSNLIESHKYHYRDSIIPDAESFAAEMARSLNLPDNEELTVSFDHIEIMQEDKNKKSTRNKTTTDSILAIQKSVKGGNTTVNSGVRILMVVHGMSENEAREIIE